MIGCDKFCTYCIVPSVRGPEQSRHPEHIAAEVRQLAARRLQGDHAAGPDRQQLPLRHGRRPACAAVRSAREDSRHAGHRADQVHHQLPQGHDATICSTRCAICRRCARICTCRPSRAATKCCKRMKRLYTVEFYREMLAALPRDGAGRGDQQRLHRRLLRRDGGIVRADLRPGARGRLQEQLHLQVQPAARHQGARAVRRRRARGGQETPQQRPAGDPERR